MSARPPWPVLARLLGLEFQRIQFTSDMPADILGVHLQPTMRRSAFIPARVLPLVLADEVSPHPNLRRPRPEAMEERQISAEGRTTGLPTPFFVIAAVAGRSAYRKASGTLYNLRIALGCGRYADDTGEARI